MRQYRIRVSEDALGSMALAAIEAYAFGEGTKRKRRGLETYGYLWGHTKRETELTQYYLTKLSVSISAERERASVVPNDDAGRLKARFMDRWAPELTLLGDFHTHPFKDQPLVRSVKGYEFSDNDFEAFQNDELLWEQTEISPVEIAPVMLVMTICRQKRVREATYEQKRNNICSFAVGEFKFWLNAVVGEMDGETRTSTQNTHSSVFLDLGSRFLNAARDRIEFG
jgi:hypothetical protein